MNPIKNLSDEQKIAVMQTGYQLLVSAAGRQLDKRDDPSIDIILEYCGFRKESISGHIGNIFWAKAIKTNPYTAFDMVKRMTYEQKIGVKEMLDCLANKDNVLLRKDIANQLKILLML